MVKNRILTLLRLLPSIKLKPLMKNYVLRFQNQFNFLIYRNENIAQIRGPEWLAPRRQLAFYYSEEEPTNSSLVFDLFFKGNQLKVNLANLKFSKISDGP